MTFLQQQPVSSKLRAIVLLVASSLVVTAGPALAQGCNTAPVAVDDATDHFGQVTLFDATANDADADADPLTVTVLSETCPGSVTVEDGQLLLTPAQLGVPRNCSATYRISDGSASSQAVVTYGAQELLVFDDSFEVGSAGAWSSCVGC